MSLRKMQSALPDLIGRTIKHVVVSEHADHHTQVYLFFTDGTYYEFYGNWINGIRHLDHGGIEMARKSGVIPEIGMLEVLSESETRIVERPGPADMPSVTASRSARG
jgi:hypothetical protein